MGICVCNNLYDCLKYYCKIVKIKYYILIKGVGDNMSKHKYVTYKNNNYDINYTRIQEKCPNGKIENRISIILRFV